jgi:hypothetical protein
MLLDFFRYKAHPYLFVRTPRAPTPSSLDAIVGFLSKSNRGTTEKVLAKNFYTGRRMFNFLMRAWSVVRFMSSRVAAPFGPPMRH